MFKDCSSYFVSLSSRTDHHLQQSIWRDSLNIYMKDKLDFIEKMFLLQVSIGYKTVSSDDLAVITEIPPIKITLNLNI